MKHIFDRLMDDAAQPHEIDLLHSVGIGIQGKCLCALGEFAALAVTSAVERFRPEFDLHIQSDSSKAA
jgi:NADH-quinone oxidoreductase subunit F